MPRPPIASAATENPSANTRLLVRGVNWLGDAVMSTPALLRLREAQPNAFIALLTPAKLADLWFGHRAIDAVIPLAAHESLFSIARRLRQDRFQIGLVLPNSFRSALEMWWARIPRRVGSAGQCRQWLLTEALAPRPGAVPMHKRSDREIRRLVRDESSEVVIQAPEAVGPAPAGTPGSAHHLFQYLHLASHLGASTVPLAPALFVSTSEVTQVLARFGITDDPGRPLLGLNPGAEYGPAKRWPAERFIAAARQIQTRNGCRWLIFGGPSDRELAARVTAGIQGHTVQGVRGVMNLSGATSLRELCALFKACQVVLTNDTGPMHVAAAVGTPVVVPFGSTSAALTGPGLPGSSPHRLLRAPVPCAPCFRRECPIDFRCMRGIREVEVVNAILTLQQSTKGTP